MKNKKRLKGEVMYTSVEAAELLGVTPRTIQIWADSGVLPARKTSGGHRRFSESVLEAFVKKMDQESETETGEAKQTPEESAVYRILIAEDEPDLRTLYEMTMEGWDLPIQIKLVNDGYEALIRLGTDQPNMLIADLNMPKMDGFHMLNSINNADTAIDIEVVVVTALSQNDIEMHGGLPENVTIFHKPIPFPQLKQFIADKINHKKTPKT